MEHTLEDVGALMVLPELVSLILLIGVIGYPIHRLSIGSN
jgi:hypothetical protein